MPESHNTKKNLGLRRSLRKTMPKGERILWGHLRAGRSAGVKFRRQVDVGPYVVDFLCPQLKLVIEVDGLSHDSEEAAQKDLTRQKYLEDLGLKIRRYTSEQVFNNLSDVLEDVYHFCLSIQSK